MLTSYTVFTSRRLSNNVGMLHSEMSMLFSSRSQWSWDTASVSFVSVRKRY